MPIPKIIHYCWLSNQAKSDVIQHCMSSWKKYAPDYTFVEWNSQTFDVQSTAFTAYWYRKKVWSFVSDYVRLYALYTQGGFYLDSDTELIKPLDELLKYEAVLALEQPTEDPPASIEAACMGSRPKHPFFKKAMQRLEQDRTKKKRKYQFIPDALAEELKKFGIRRLIPQTFQDIKIFPYTYFSPLLYPEKAAILKHKPKHVSKLDYILTHRTCFIKSETYAMHWKERSWFRKNRIKHFLKTVRVYLRKFTIYRVLERPVKILLQKQQKLRSKYSKIS